jgi:hypothetical protein
VAFKLRLAGVGSVLFSFLKGVNDFFSILIFFGKKKRRGHVTRQGKRHVVCISKWWLEN